MVSVAHPLPAPRPGATAVPVRDVLAQAPGCAAALERLVRACAAIVVTLAGLVLCGWILDEPGLVRLGLAGGAMAPNTAPGLLGAGIALALHVSGQAVLARWLALVPLSIGVLTTAQYVAGVDLGIDTILSSDPHALMRTQHAARMAPLTALGLLLAGCALLLTGSPSRWAATTAPWTGVLLLVLAVFALFGLGFDAAHLQLSSGARGIAVPTVVCLLALAIALVCLRAESGPAAIFLAPGSGGQMARRVLPATVLAPALTGWLLLQGIEAGHYGVEGFAALTALLTFLIVSGLCWSLARALEQRSESERRAFESLARNEKLLNLAQEASHLGGWDIDVATGRIRWTREVYRIHEVGPDHDPNDLQRNLAFYLPEDRERLALAVSAACARGEPWELESRLRTATGRQIWVRTQGRAERSEGRVARVFGYIMDITERRATLDALEAARAGLEQRVTERTCQLQAANQELEAFAYSVSHDLRAPLRSIDGFASILEEDYADRLDDEGRNALQRVRANAQKMAGLIDDLLKLSRLSRAELTAEPIDLAELARASLAALQAAEPGRQVVLDVASSLPAHGDRHLLGVVMDNLVGNAWKFTGRHPSARIEIGLEEQDGQRAYFVRDDGAGFDMAHVGNLFAPFQRLHGTAEFPGTGIGLSLVRRIIQRHGGRIWAEGAVERGATFRFTLPPRAAEPRTGASNASN